MLEVHASQKRCISKKFYNLRCITCTVKITDFEKKRKGKDRRQHYKSNALYFLSLVTYIEVGYKSRRGENIYLTSWQLQGNLIVLFIESLCCQCWLHHSFQTSILKDMLLVILKWFWLTLAYILHLTEQFPIQFPLYHVEKIPAHMVVYLACSDPSRQIFYFYFFMRREIVVLKLWFETVFLILCEVLWFSVRLFNGKKKLNIPCHIVWRSML